MAAAMRHGGRRATKETLEDIVNRLVSSSFPSLAQHKIAVRIETSDKFIAAADSFERPVSIVFSKEDVYHMSADALVGVAAHELCHLEDDFSRPYWLRVVRETWRRLIPMSETRHERYIDGLVVQKGFGKELLAFQEYHDNIYESYTEKDGLTASEIRAML